MTLRRSPGTTALTGGSVAAEPAPGVVGERSERGAEPRPNFFIVGAPKCGTSALYEYLAAHPDVFMSTEKEPHFFSTDLHFVQHRVIALDEYLSYFAGARGERRLGEASTSYLYSRQAAENIARFDPAARIVIMLRNPVDMMHALHSEHVYWAVEDVPDFEEALRLEKERQAGGRVPPRIGWLEQSGYRDIARYAQHVERYFRVFGRAQVHVGLLDDLERAPDRVYDEVLRFLGVGTAFRPEFRVVNPNKRVRSRLLRDLLRARPRPVRGLARALLGASRRRWVARRLRLLNTRAEPRPPLDEGLRRRLQAEFAPEVERLGVLLGRDLTHWTGAGA